MEGAGDGAARRGVRVPAGCGSEASGGGLGLLLFEWVRDKS